MSEKWTGRKYRGRTSGGVYEILSEPFVWEGESHIVYLADCDSEPRILTSRAFETGPAYERIIEPKYAVGDKVTTVHGGTWTIEAVTTKTDVDGDRPYLAIYEDGNADVIWEHYLTKVSE